jgi:hypothetical protein
MQSILACASGVRIGAQRNATQRNPSPNPVPPPYRGEGLPGQPLTSWPPDASTLGFVGERAKLGEQAIEEPAEDA